MKEKANSSKPIEWRSAEYHKRKAENTMDYKNALIKLLGKLSEGSVRRLYQLAEYLYIYKG